LARREEILELLARIVDGGRDESKNTVEPPVIASEGVVGGVLAVIQSRLSREEASLVGLVNHLMSMIVLPYLGAGAAKGELEREVIELPTISAGPSFERDPFKKAGLRLTYRTVRVLLAVADNPGASNRQIAQIAGMTDQGQASKLLGRLKRLE